jgi:hypothetical protein
VFIEPDNRHVNNHEHGERARAVREAAQVLKKRGKLVIADIRRKETAGPLCFPLSAKSGSHLRLIHP